MQLSQLSMYLRTQITQEAVDRVKNDAHPFIVQLCDIYNNSEVAEICQEYFLRAIYLYNNDTDYNKLLVPLQITISPLCSVSEYFAHVLEGACQSSRCMETNKVVERNKMSCWLSVQLESGCIMQHAMCAIHVDNVSTPLSFEPLSLRTLESNSTHFTPQEYNELTNRELIWNEINQETKYSLPENKQRYESSRASLQLPDRYTILETQQRQHKSPEIVLPTREVAQQPNIDIKTSMLQRENNEIELTKSKDTIADNANKIYPLIVQTPKSEMKSIPCTPFVEQREELWRLADADMTHTLYNHNDHATLKYTPIKYISEVSV